MSSFDRRNTKEGAQDTRRMHQQLALSTPPQNLTLSIVEAADHNEAAWRAEFPRVVVWLYGPQPTASAPPAD